MRSLNVACWCLPPAARYPLAVAVLYGGISMTLALVNKTLLSSYKFECYFTLLTAQMLLSYGFCVATRDYLGNPFAIAPFSWATVRAALPMGTLYVLNVGFGLVGLRLVNVPMFFCIRRLVSPTILLLEFVTMGRVADAGTQVAVALIMFGTLLAGYETLTAEVLGYGITLLNNLCTAGASVMQKRFSEAGVVGAPVTDGAGGDAQPSSSSLSAAAAPSLPAGAAPAAAASPLSRPSTFTIVYYNSLIALPLSFALLVSTGEVQTLRTFDGLSDPAFIGGFMIAASMGLALTYSSFLCTTVNSPLATSVTGNVKDIATTVLGALMFPGFVATPSNVLGLTLSFVGAYVYSYVGMLKARVPAGKGGGGAAGAGGDAEAGGGDGRGAGGRGLGSAALVAGILAQPGAAVRRQAQQATQVAGGSGDDSPSPGAPAEPSRLLSSGVSTGGGNAVNRLRGADAAR